MKKQTVIILKHKNHQGTEKNVSNIAKMLIVEYFLIAHNTIISVDDICYDSWGKPSLKRKEKFISITHSEQLVLVAIADFNIGIDTEPRERKISPELYHYIVDLKKEVIHGDPIVACWTKKKQ